MQSILSQFTIHWRTFMALQLAHASIENDFTLAMISQLFKPLVNPLHSNLALWLINSSVSTSSCQTTSPKTAQELSSNNFHYTTNSWDVSNPVCVGYSVFVFPVPFRNGVLWHRTQIWRFFPSSCRRKKKDLHSSFRWGGRLSCRSRTS